MRELRLDLPVIQLGLCQHQRRQKSDGTAGARCLAQLDEQGQHAQKCLIGGDRAKLHDVGCHVIHNACCEAGLKSQREVVVPGHRDTLDCRTCALTSRSSMPKLYTSRENEGEQICKNERRG